MLKMQMSCLRHIPFSPMGLASRGRECSFWYKYKIVLKMIDMHVNGMYNQLQIMPLMEEVK